MTDGNNEVRSQRIARECMVGYGAGREWKGVRDSSGKGYLPAGKVTGNSWRYLSRGIKRMERWREGSQNSVRGRRMSPYASIRGFPEDRRVRQEALD